MTDKRETDMAVAVTLTRMRELHGMASEIERHGRRVVIDILTGEAYIFETGEDQHLQLGFCGIPISKMTQGN
jgi:hypothetical protein